MESGVPIPGFIAQLLGLDGYLLLPDQCHVRDGKWELAIMPTARMVVCADPECGSKNIIKHGSYTRVIAHVPVGAKRTRLHIFVPRWICKDCGKTCALSLPGITVGHNVSEDLMAFLLDRFQSRQPYVQIAFDSGISENTAARSIKQQVDAINQSRRKVLPEAIGFDEIRIHRGDNGLWTHVTNLETGETIAIFSGTSAGHVQHFLGEQDDVSAVKAYSADGAAQYLSMGKDNFPDAEGSLDRFHVVKALLKGVKEARKSPAKKQSRESAGTDEMTDRDDSRASE